MDTLGLWLHTQFTLTEHGYQIFHQQDEGWPRPRWSDLTGILFANESAYIVGLAVEVVLLEGALREATGR